MDKAAATIPYTAEHSARVGLGCQASLEACFDLGMSKKVQHGFLARFVWLGKSSIIALKYFLLVHMSIWKTRFKGKRNHYGGSVPIPVADVVVLRKVIFVSLGLC
jgi:hypothetical protein